MIPTLLLTLALGTGGGVKVNLPAQAEVTGAEFALGDVARVEGDDEAAAQRLRSLHLGYAPAPGYSRRSLTSKRRQKRAWGEPI